MMKIKPIKRMVYKDYALNFGTQLPKRKDIKLLGTQARNIIKSHTFVTRQDFDNGNIETFDSIPDGYNFLYKIEQYTKEERPNLEKDRQPPRKLEKMEQGLGFIETIDGNRFLKRDSVYKMFTEEDGALSFTGGGPRFAFDVDKILIITTTIPHNHRFLFAAESSVLCSASSFLPDAVPLENNTVLGKIQDKIQDISGIELADIIGDEGFAKLLTNHSSPIRSQSSQFYLAGENSIFISNSIQIKGTQRRPQKPNAGTIIYHSRKKCFEGYDGRKWRPLKWGDE